MLEMFVFSCNTVSRYFVCLFTLFDVCLCLVTRYPCGHCSETFENRSLRKKHIDSTHPEIAGIFELRVGFGCNVELIQVYLNSICLNRFCVFFFSASFCQRELVLLPLGRRNIVQFTTYVHAANLKSFFRYRHIIEARTVSVTTNKQKFDDHLKLQKNIIEETKSKKCARNTVFETLYQKYINITTYASNKRL